MCSKNIFKIFSTVIKKRERININLNINLNYYKQENIDIAGFEFFGYKIYYLSDDRLKFRFLFCNLTPQNSIKKGPFENVENKPLSAIAALMDSEL